MPQRGYVRNHWQLPAIPTGYELNPLRGFFEVIIPEATVNLVTNPSGERGTTGHVASNGASIARSAVRQRHGVYSIAVTPSSNVNSGKYWPLSFTSGQVYSYSVAVWGAPGVPYRITIATDAAVILNRYEFRGEGRWRRFWVNATPTTTATHRLYVEKNNSASTAVFYVDGEQCEAKAYPTTYCDGDQRGFVPYRQDYLWNGAPHASTSTRSAQCRAGGKIVNLSDFGFRLITYLSLGLLPFGATATPAGIQGGSYYQGSTAGERSFSIQGRFDVGSFSQLQRNRTTFQNAVWPKLVTPDQPVLLRYQAYDEERPTGDVLEIPAVYQGGLEGSTDNLYSDETTVTFTMHLPYIVREGDAGASLTFWEVITSVGEIAYRNPTTGDWSMLDAGAGPNGTVTVIKRNPVNGLWYIGGAFTSVSGLANTQGIVSWNPATSAYAAVGTGVNNTVWDIDFDSAGNVITVGDFTTAGGGAAVRIAKFTIATSVWSAFGAGLNGRGNAVVVDIENNIYVTGAFTTADAVARARIVKISAAGTYSTMGSGLDNTGYTLVLGANGLTLYMGGQFLAAGGVAGAQYFALWDGSNFVALGTTAFNNNVYALLRAPDNSIYIGGAFTAPYGRILRYNGVGYTGVGALLGTDVQSMALDPSTGAIYVVGLLINASGNALPYTAVVWDGSSYHPVDMIGPGGSAGVTVYAVGVGPDGTVLMGLDSALGNGLGAGVTAVTNNGTADTAPIFTLTGPGTAYSIRNPTTGHELYFKNLILLEGEIAVLDLTPGNISFRSNFRSNMLPYILDGSDLATWRLQASANSVSVLFGSDTGANTAITARWRDTFGSSDGGTP